MKVRTFTEADIEPMITMGGVMHRESVYHWLPYEPQALRNLGRAALDNPNEIGAFVAETSTGELAGQMLVCRQRYFFNSVLHCVDIVFYVLPQFRGTSAAVRLMLAAETWAKFNECVELRFGESAQINPDLVDRLFKKREFSPRGTLYTKLVH